MPNKPNIFLISFIIFTSISGYSQLTNFDVQQVRVLYESLEYDKAISTGNLLLKSNYSFNKNDFIILHEYMALSFYNVGNIDSSRSHFLSLLSINPKYDLDPIKVSPKIIDFFNQLKSEIKSPYEKVELVPYKEYVFTGINIQDVLKQVTATKNTPLTYSQVKKVKCHSLDSYKQPRNTMETLNSRVELN